MTAPADRLAEIKARAEAATGGPWAFEGNERDACGVFDEGTGELFVFSPDPQSTGDFRADLAFIAHTRIDVPSMAEALQRVLALHRGRPMDELLVCGECIRGNGSAVRYPCETVSAITSALETA